MRMPPCQGMAALEAQRLNLNEHVGQGHMIKVHPRPRKGIMWTTDLHWPRIKEIDLRGLELVGQGPDLRCCEKLTALDLRINQVAQPPVLSSGLEELRLSDNFLHTPPDISRCTKLRKCFLYNNPFDYVASSGKLDVSKMRPLRVRLPAMFRLHAGWRGSLPSLQHT